jgi:hypothetical protein
MAQFERVMKLPQYDNRPPVGTPLYRDVDDKAAWEDVKYPLVVFGIVAGVLASALLILFAIFRSLLG